MSRTCHGTPKGISRLPMAPMTPPMTPQGGASGTEGLVLPLHRLGAREEVGRDEIAGRLAVADGHEPVALVREGRQRGERALPLARVVPQPPLLDVRPHG